MTGWGKLHLLLGLLRGHLREGLQALQQAGPNVDGVYGRPGGLPSSCEKASLGGLHVSSLCSQAILKSLQSSWQPCVL